MNPELKRFVADLREDLIHNRLDLPSLPEVTFRLRREIDSPNSTVSTIARLISTDAGLSARVLRVANSPFFRGLARIETVNDAVSRLGRNCIKNMVISLMMSELYRTRKSHHIKRRLRTLWEHGTKVAATSQVLAKRFTDLDPNEALLAGLIHNIGALPILKRFTEYPELFSDETILDKLIRGLHKEVGTYVLRRWDFPPELVAIPTQHENLQRTHSGVCDFVDLVTVANLHACVGTPNPLAKTRWVDVPAFEKIGLTPELSIEAMREARDEIAGMQRLLM